MIKFELIDQEYIQLNNLLKVLNLVETGGEANQVIVQGDVKLNGNVEIQKRKKIRVGDIIEFQKKTIKISN